MVRKKNNPKKMLNVFERVLIIEFITKMPRDCPKIVLLIATLCVTSGSEALSSYIYVLLKLNLVQDGEMVVGCQGRYLPTE